MSKYCLQSAFFAIVGQPVPSPSRLAVFENRIYWSDGTKQGIMSVDKYDGANSIQVVYKNKEVREPKAVKIVDNLLQRHGMWPLSYFIDYIDNNIHKLTCTYFFYK